MNDSERFTVKEMIECGAGLRKLGEGADSMVDLAHRTVEHLYTNLGAGAQPQSACALVRFYLTQPYVGLSTALQGIVHSETDITIINETPVLTCIASKGSRPEWCSNHAESIEEVMALPNPSLADEHPVVAQMVARFDLPGAFAVPYNPDLFLEEPGRSFDLLHLPDTMAEGSIMAPQAEFVQSNGIKSMVGFGGLLPSRNMFAIIIFSTIPILKQAALAFRPFALNTKIALLPFDDGHPLFSSQVMANGRR